MNAPENHGERVQSAWATSALAPASSSAYAPVMRPASIV